MEVQITSILDVVGGIRLGFEVSDSEPYCPAIYDVRVLFAYAVGLPLSPAPLVAGSLKGHLKRQNIGPVIIGNRILGVIAQRAYSVVVDAITIGWLPGHFSNGYLCLKICHTSVLDMINECS